MVVGWGGIVGGWQGMGVLLDNWGVSVVGNWSMGHSLNDSWGMGNGLDDSWSLDDGLDNWSGGDDLMFQGFTADVGDEASVGIRAVVNDASVSVSIDQGVLAFNFVAVAAFVLALDVPGVRVMDRVGEVVVGWGLNFDDLLDQSWLGNRLDDGWGGIVSDSWGGSVVLDNRGGVLVGGVGWLWDDSGAGHGQESEDGDELWNKSGKIIVNEIIPVCFWREIFTLNAILLVLFQKWRFWCVETVKLST
jgi:hypothetical protein